MSTKSTITHGDYGGQSFHLYSELFSDMIFLEVGRNEMSVTVQLPLPFALSVAKSLTEHVVPIQKLIQASDEDIRAMAREHAIFVVSNPFLKRCYDVEVIKDEARLLDEIEADRFRELKERQARYLEECKEA